MVLEVLYPSNGARDAKALKAGYALLNPTPKSQWYTDIFYSSTSSLPVPYVFKADSSINIESPYSMKEQPEVLEHKVEDARKAGLLLQL
jgi:hypothetical protein